MPPARYRSPAGAAAGVPVRFVLPCRGQAPCLLYTALWGSHLAAAPAAGNIPHCSFFIVHCAFPRHFNSPAISYMKFPQNRALFSFVIFLVISYSEHAIFCPQFSPLLRNLTPPCAKKSAFWATLGLHIAFEMRYTAR